MTILANQSKWKKKPKWKNFFPLDLDINLLKNKGEINPSGNGSVFLGKILFFLYFKKSKNKSKILSRFHLDKYLVNNIYINNYILTTYVFSHGQNPSGAFFPPFHLDSVR